MMPRDYRVLPNFAWSIANGEVISVYGDGNQTRTFCYVTDAIVGFFKVLVESPNPDVYNIGNPQPEISMNDLALLVGKITGNNPKIKHVPYPESYPADEPMRRCPDVYKARSILGYQALVSLEEGLKRFFFWSEIYYQKIR
jgi:UDP-glucuronate decarboxylase